MKQLFLSIVLLFGAVNLYAQTEAFVATSAASGPSGSSTLPAKKQAIGMREVIYITPANQWSLIEMKSFGDMVHFKYLDGMNDLKVIVTNSNGVSVMEMKVSAKANGINCKKLKKGLYFMTLVNDATDEKKAFMFNKE